MLIWNRDEGFVTATIRSNIAQSIKISCRIGKGAIKASNNTVYENGSLIKFEKGEEISIRMSI